MLSPARSGGDVGAEMMCLHNHHCQRANEASLGHMSGLATDEWKPEGTASREGRWRSLCFPTVWCRQTEAPILIMSGKKISCQRDIGGTDVLRGTLVSFLN